MRDGSETHEMGDYSSGRFFWGEHLHLSLFRWLGMEIFIFSEGSSALKQETAAALSATRGRKFQNVPHFICGHN